MKDRVIGTLEYYGPNGVVAEKIDYTNPEKMQKQLSEDMDCGRPVIATAYTRPGQGPVVTEQWFHEHVCGTSACYKMEYLPGRRAKRSISKRKEREER